jgi:integrase
MGARVRDFHTVDAEQLLQTIARENPAFTHSTFARLKSLLSGIFTHALRMGVIAGSNPISPISIPRGSQSKQTYAYSLEETQQILRLIPEPAKTAFAVGAFAGLREGEIRGLDWIDYDGDTLTVARSIWRKHVNLPKTLQSQAAVPVIKPLRDLLDGMKPRNAVGSIFRGELGRPLDLHNVARRVIRPTLALHGLTWHGWHAARRGLATNLHRLGGPRPDNSADSASLEHRGYDAELRQGRGCRRRVRDDKTRRTIFCSPSVPHGAVNRSYLLDLW